MILIGQFDSPFVRRIGIALELYGIAYEHKPWSTFGDADRIAAYNPLLRVPTLVLDGGEALVETLAILDTLDEMAGRDRALIPSSGPSRRKILQVAARAGGVSDKAVSLFYSQRFHESASPDYIARVRSQIAETFGWLERDRAAPAREWWVDGRLTHADIAVAATLRHFRDAIGEGWDFSRWPALLAHSEQCEALPVFQKISQPFVFTPAKR